MSNMLISFVSHLSHSQVVSTLKVNINREKEARLKKILGLKKDWVSFISFINGSKIISKIESKIKPT